MREDAVKAPRITDATVTRMAVPLKTRHDRHLTRENWDWTVFEIVRLATDSALEGIGETMVFYNGGSVSEKERQAVIGRSPYELLWDDSLGWGMQMAVYDLAAKAAEVPCYRLLGKKVRDWCPISWWTNCMSLEDWIEEVREAVSLGYTSAKLKARPWRDLINDMHAVANVVPSGFQFDADFNSFLLDVGEAVPVLRALEGVPGMHIFETPIPQGDVEGNRILRQKVGLPIAMHYGSPPVQTAIRDEVCDGFVIGGMAERTRQSGELAAQMSKPFFLQMVGTGLTTAWMLHWGAVLSWATWPAISCWEIYTDDLITERLAINAGYGRVPEAPGLGIELDEEALARYTVPRDYCPDPPRNLYRVIWPNGAQVTYRVGKEGVWDDFAAGNQPAFTPGVRLEIIPDDGSQAWQELHAACQQGPVRHV